MSREADPRDRPRRTWIGRWTRRILFPLLAIAIGLVLAVVLLEATLRLRPQIFSYRFQNLAFSKYDILPDGMYVLVPSIRTRVMRSRFSTRCCFNGYCWEHRTDRFGFRGPDDLEARDVLLFGDSMIYGHGVEERDTVAGILRAEHGVAAYNMARQGDCLYDCYVMFRMYAAQFQPRVAVLFVFLNDFADVEGHRRPEERADPPEIDRYDYDAVRRVADELQAARPPLLGRALYRLHSVRITVQTLRNLDRVLGRVELSRPAEAAAPPREPYFIDPILDPVRWQPLADYYERIVPDLDRRCRERGARLLVVNLHLHKPRRPDSYQRAQDIVRGFVSDLCSRHGIAYLDTGEVFADSWQRCYLEHDGHLSPEGHRRLAAFLALETPFLDGGD